jgi:hypothetical protein
MAADADQSPRIVSRASGAAKFALLIRGISRKRRPANVANFIAREPARPVHRRAIVPDDEIPWPPAVAIDELRLRGVLGQVAQEHPRFGDVPADDGAGMRRKE